MNHDQRAIIEKIKSEFPTYDTDTLPDIPAGWTCEAWKNDVAPFFLVRTLENGNVLRVLIDFPQEEHREIPGPRFNAYLYPPPDFSGSDLVIETDEWPALLAAVANVR